MRMTSAPPGDAAVQREEARVAAHDLHHHDAIMGLGGGVQPVDGLGADGARGVEAEGLVRAGQIVVDRLRAADHLEALARELVADGQRAVSADGDQTVELQLLGAAEDSVGRRSFSTHLPFSLHGVLEGVGLVGGAQDGAALGEDAAGVLVGEGAGEVGLDQAHVAILDAHELVAELVDARASPVPE